jgi:cytochrome c5
MTGNPSGRVYLGVLIAGLFVIAAMACSEEAVDPAVAICDEVFSIDDDVLAERLSPQQLVTRLDHLEFELLPEARGEVEDAADRFIWAAREIAESSTYDYPTFQVLNYLDTYEQMAFHVHAFEAVNDMRRTCAALDKIWVGDAPVITEHVSQRGIEYGKYTIEELIDFGEALFVASFNTLDGAGRPRLTGAGESRPRRDSPDNFNRISGPDSNACSGCHNLPGAGGGGDNVANVFVRAQELDFVDFDNQFDDRKEVEVGAAIDLQNVANERGTVGMFGSGLIELLAREMTADLHDIRDEALNSSSKSGQPVAADLVTKGIRFGSITAHPSGAIDTTLVVGVDYDLVIRPFHQKGVVASLRGFTNNALNHHHGLQTYERTGAGKDPDGDGVRNEITPGDTTALVVFQATLPMPTQRVATDDDQKRRVASGKALFDSVGCSACHVQEMPLKSLIFTEPGPYNSGKDLVPGKVDALLEIDLADYSPTLKQNSDGEYLIPVFTDLKRHKMGDELNNELLEQDDVPTDEWLTKKLWGFVSEPPFLHHGRATLISEAIEAHGGDSQPSRDAFMGLSEDDRNAIIEFLKTLVIVPAS